jgi:hypothetical protein
MFTESIRQQDRTKYMLQLLKRLVPSKAYIIEKLVWIVRWADKHVPPGVRTLFGIPLMIGGILSFLPVLGIWMLPAGAMMIALDVPPWRRRMLRWVDRQEAAVNRPDADESTGRNTSNTTGDTTGEAGKS